MKKKELLWAVKVNEARQKLTEIFEALGAWTEGYGIFKVLDGASEVLERNSPYYADADDERQDEFFDLLNSKKSSEKKLEMILRGSDGKTDEKTMKKDLLWAIEVQEAYDELEAALYEIGAMPNDSNVCKVLDTAYEVLKENSPYYTDERALPYSESKRLDDEFYELIHSKKSKKKKLEQLLRKPDGKE